MDSSSLESRVNIRDGFKALGLHQPDILWPEAIPDPEIRLILTRENYLRSGVGGKSARDTSTVLPGNALWERWLKDRVVGSRARVGIVKGAEGLALLVVGFSDSFELAADQISITL